MKTVAKCVALGMALIVAVFVSVFVYPVMAVCAVVFAVLLVTNVRGVGSAIAASRSWRWIPGLGRAPRFLAGGILLLWAGGSSGTGYAFWDWSAGQAHSRAINATATALVAGPVPTQTHSASKERPSPIPAPTATIMPRATMTATRVTPVTTSVVGLGETRRRRAMVRAHETAAADARSTATAYAQTTASALKIQAQAKARRHVLRLGTPGPTDPVNPRPGLGAQKATFDRSWTVAHDQGGLCSVQQGCWYDIDGLQVAVTFGDNHRADSLDLDIQDRARHADIWSFEQTLLPPHAALEQCRIVSPTFQGPAHACIYTWEGRRLVRAFYLNPAAASPDSYASPGLVSEVSAGPYDDLLQAGKKAHLVPAGVGAVATAIPVPPTAQPTPNGIQTWLASTAQVSRHFTAIRNDMKTAVLDYSNGQIVAANVDLRGAEAQYQAALAAWNNGPLAPPPWRHADTLVHDEVLQWGNAINDMQMGLDSNSRESFNQAVSAIKTASADDTAASNAMLSGR